MSDAEVLEYFAPRSEPRLLNEKEAADYLRVSPETLRRYRRRRRLAFVKVGRRPLYSVAQLEAFIHKNVVPALGDRRRP